MESLVQHSQVQASKVAEPEEVAFEFERLVRVVSVNMLEQDLASLNKFREWEILLNSDLEILIFNQSPQFIDKLKQDYKAYVKSVGEARKVLSVAFQKNPDPNQARGNWDSGREFEKRELHENTLIKLQSYIEKSYHITNNAYLEVVELVKPIQGEVMTPVAQLASRKELELFSFSPTPLHDVMNYKA